MLDLSIFEKMGIELIWIPRLDTFNTSLICEKNGFFVLNEKRFENNRFDIKVKYDNHYDCYFLVDYSTPVGYQQLRYFPMWNIRGKYYYTDYTSAKVYDYNYIRVIGCSKCIDDNASVKNIDMDLSNLIGFRLL